MNSIVIFGTGNVAHHLSKAFSSAKDFRVIQVYNHKPESLKSFSTETETTINLAKVKPADIYLMAVKDDAISEIADHIIYKDALMLHTSGAVDIEVFSNFSRRGVFYPLQTFSKNKEVDFSQIPLCIEANKKDDLQLLESLGKSISENVYHINSQQRRSLHVAAVFVSNFVNYLYTEGEAICKKNNIPFEILQPLIMETASKVTRMSPMEAQTGPAKRNDVGVLQSHLSQLNKEQQKIYSLLTQSIQALHGKEL